MQKTLRSLSIVGMITLMFTSPIPASADPFTDSSLANLTSPTQTQDQQPPQEDKEISFDENGHTYKLKYDSKSQNFISYYDGQEAKEVSFNEMKKMVNDAIVSEQMERSPNKCDVAMAIASVIHGALWTAAAITAPESGGATVAIAGFVTSLIPTGGSLVAC